MDGRVRDKAEEDCANIRNWNLSQQCVASHPACSIVRLLISFVFGSVFVLDLCLYCYLHCIKQFVVPFLSWFLICFCLWKFLFVFVFLLVFNSACD